MMDMLLTSRAPRPAPSRRRVLAGLGALGALGAVGLASRGTVPAARAATRDLQGATMGTTYTVRIAVGADGRPLGDREAEALHADVQSVFDGVDHTMSLHRPASELRRFNARPAGMVALSEPFLDVLREACAVAAWSDGAFDPTVAPLVEAWGFGAAKPVGAPSPQDIAAHRARIGWGGLALDPARRAATKARDGLALDFGGVAKGYGVEAVAGLLLARGFRDFMVEAGGEVRAEGRNAAGRAWAIGIEQPDLWPQQARLVLGLSGGAMATSGDYRNLVEHDGRRFPHEIDPRSGAPIARDLASVTVVAADATRADALATALIVLGARDGLARAERDGLAALFILRDEAGRLTDAPTAAFAALGARRVG